MSRTFFFLRRKRGYGSRHPVPCQIGITLESCVLPCGFGSVSVTAILQQLTDSAIQYLSTQSKPNNSRYCLKYPLTSSRGLSQRTALPRAERPHWTEKLV